MELLHLVVRVRVRFSYVPEIYLAPMIDHHRADLDRLASECQLILEVELIRPLESDDHPSWDAEDGWEGWARLIAASEVAGDRRWRKVVPKLFELASDGDLDDRMQTIRHGPEKAFSPDWADMAAALHPLVEHPRQGTRRWVMRELGILEQRASLPFVLRALQDPVEIVRYEAGEALKRLQRAG